MNNSKQQKNKRREAALIRWEKDLESNTKPNRDPYIRNQIKILKTKLNKS